MGHKNSKNKNLQRTKTVENDEEIQIELKNPIKFIKYKEIEVLGKIFKKIDKIKYKVNYLKYIDFNDYMISLSFFSIQKADLKDDYQKIKYCYSCNDKFYDEPFNIEYLQSFIESKILKHPQVYEKAFHSDNSQDRVLLFKDLLFNLHKGLLPKIKQIELENGVSEDELNENTIMKKNVAIVYGLLFCGGDDWVKIRILFHLFKENGKLKMSENFDFFLFILFTTATYAMCYARNQISKYKIIGEIPKEYLEIAIAMFKNETTKSVIEYTNKLLFGEDKKNELSYEQFRKKFEVNEKKGIGFIFNTRGIRYMYKELSGLAFEKKKKRYSLKKV